MASPKPQIAPEPASQENKEDQVSQAPEPMKRPEPTPEVSSEPQEKTVSAPKAIKASPVAPTPPIEQRPEPPIASSPVPEAKPEPSSVPKPVIPNPEIVSIDVRFDRVTMIDKRPVGTVQVEVEETLGHYAEWAGIRAQQIRRLNGLRFGRTLHLHQQIKIPLDKTTAAAFEEQRYEYHKRLQEDFFAVYRVSELEPYRVQPGDNVWMLCREKFDVPMWLLKHYNMEVDLAALRIQQKLMIPVIDQTTADDPGTVTNGEVADTIAPE